MTIDEAIEHAEEIACGNDQCAKDHAQLADWLRELRQVRIDIEVLKIFRDGFKEDAQKYKAENAKLRELCEGMLVCYEPCNEHLDARTDCPLYDENEPLRCRKARLLRELGIGVKE